MLLRGVLREAAALAFLGRFGALARSHYNVPMANHAYAAVWCPAFGADVQLERLEQFLSTVPFAATRPGFTGLVIRAVSPAETPLIEPDLRASPADAAAIVEVAREFQNGDCAYEVQAHWDLWAFGSASEKFVSQPELVEIFCHGEEYDDGVWKELGHFQVDLGLEHLFTGHGRLLGFRSGQPSRAEHPDEARFFELMTQPAKLEEYRDKTKENIRKLFDWMRRIEHAMPVKNTRLWSEGEDNFEARIEEILAAR
jgi:hypothetical protein